VKPRRCQSGHGSAALAVSYKESSRIAAAISFRWDSTPTAPSAYSERFVDATVEQFDEIREIGAGPMIGRVALSTHDDGSMMQPGAQVMLQRGDLVLTYTVAGPDALASIVEHPEMAAHAGDHHRTGVNVASFALAALRGEGVRGRAMQAPHPRLRALLRAVADAPYEAGESGDVRFRLADQAGREQWLRLDEIPLPPSVPAAWPRP